MGVISNLFSLLIACFIVCVAKENVLIPGIHVKANIGFVGSMFP